MKIRRRARSRLAEELPKPKQIQAVTILTQVTLAVLKPTTSLNVRNKLIMQETLTATIIKFRAQLLMPMITATTVVMVQIPQETYNIQEVQAIKLNKHFRSS